jgi:hypothetical protein
MRAFLAAQVAGWQQQILDRVLREMNEGYPLPSAILENQAGVPRSQTKIVPFHRNAGVQQSNWSVQHGCVVLREERCLL